MPITLPFSFVNGTIADAVQVNANFNAIASAVDAGAGAGLTPLTQNLTLYVGPSGTDTPTSGLTAGAPFATIAYAYNNLLNNYHLNGFRGTIQLASGTYNQSPVIRGFVVGVGMRGQVTIQGNVGSPSSVIINGMFDLAHTVCVLQGVRMTNPAGPCLMAETFANVAVRNVDFGAAGLAHVLARLGAMIFLDQPYMISGSADSHWNVDNASIHAHLQTPDGSAAPNGNPTITLTGTPAFSGSFANATEGGLIKSFAAFTGTATGPSYFADRNGMINTRAANNPLPGSGTGTAQNGAQVF